MDKQKALEKLSILQREINHIQDSFYHMSYCVQQYNRFKINFASAVNNIFDGEKAKRHLKTFDEIVISMRTIEDEKTYANITAELSALMTLSACMISEVNENMDDEKTIGTISLAPIEKIALLCDKFHNVATQLCHRHDERGTLTINDEYDAQDLFHALLMLYFDDIRPEEWTPSYAGSSSRMDFLLDDEKVVIELKMTRKGLGVKEAREQLIIDKEQYKTHPKCKHLICFVYDPGRLIKNSRGFEKDLSQAGEHPVTVYVRHD